MTDPAVATRRDLTGRGTPEAHWSASRVLDALPAVDPRDLRPTGRAVVVAPHPDDETLGVGGLLAAWAGAGVEVVVVAVTDGEGSHPGSPTLGPAELARRRVDERSAALAALGLPGATVVRCGLPDGEVAARVDDLAVTLVGLLRPGDLCLAPIAGDGHPDHDATAAAAGRAAAAVRGVGPVSYAVWLWHWAVPGDVDWAGAVRVVLAAPDRDAKRVAVDTFTTQVAPLSSDPRDAAILPPEVLARLVRDVEVLWWPGLREIG